MKYKELGKEADARIAYKAVKRLIEAKCHVTGAERDCLANQKYLDNLLEKDVTARVIIKGDGEIEIFLD